MPDSADYPVVVDPVDLPDIEKVTEPVGLTEELCRSVTVAVHFVEFGTVMEEGLQATATVVPSIAVTRKVIVPFIRA